MKKILATLSILVFGLFTANLAMAADAANANANNAAQDTGSQAATNDQENFIILYKDASSDSIEKRLPPNARLIPIFQQGNWLKVGLPNDGNTGWVNLVQYQKARAKYYQPDIQTIYVNVDTSKKDRPTLNIVAYKNGKIVSKEEALMLYKKLRKQQEAQYRSMQKFSLDMDEMMHQDFLNAQRFFDSAWMNPPWMEPVILVPTPDQQKGQADQKANANAETASAPKNS